MPVLLEEVASDDANVRRRAIAALGNVAGPDDVAGMIRGLLKIQDAGERDEAGRAIAAVCSRVADEARQADPVSEPVSERHSRRAARCSCPSWDGSAARRPWP